MPKHTPGSRLCRLCWKVAPVGVEMFVIIGLTPEALLACPGCAQNVLELHAKRNATSSEGGAAIDQLTIFDQIKEHLATN